MAWVYAPGGKCWINTQHIEQIIDHKTPRGDMSVYYDRAIRRRELDRHIGNEFVKNTFECGMDAALKWVLSLRREDAE